MKKILHNIAYALVLIGLNTNAAFSQSEDKKLGIELNGGWNEYKGDMGSALFFAKKPIYNGVGINLGYYVSPSIDAMIFSNTGDVGFSRWFWNEGESGFNNRSFTARLLNLSGGIRYKFNNGIILPTESKLFPYIPLGWGYQYVHSRITDRPKNLTAHSGVIHAGLGLQYNINETFSIRLQSLFNYTFNDVWDGAPFTYGPHKVVQQEDAYMYHSIGVVYNIPFGESSPSIPKPLKDSDFDGVPDKYDNCPKTPAGVEVDSVGCPIDTDGDGVPDYKDSCKTVPGLAKFDGCPDSDGDGVPDHLDKCPNEPGTPENYGCPELTEEEKAVFDLAVKGVYFKINSAELSEESFDKLDRLVKVLVNHPEISLIIEGHTDNTGNADANKRLSQERVNSVKTYLVSKGIERGRLTSIGYGQEKPMYDNATEEGRQKNRRVYFQIRYD